MKALNCLLLVSVFFMSLATTTDFCCGGELPPQTDGEAIQTGDGELSDTQVEEAAVVPEFSGADIAWMLVCSALVLMMTAPGLALFYGGLVRKKNILSVMMQCVFLMGLMSVLWAVVGYSLAFGGSNPYVGNLDHVFLRGVTPMLTADEISNVESALEATTDAGEKLESEKKLVNFKSRVAKDQFDVFTPGEGDGIPKSVFMCFQGMFFIITPALICGAFAERFKFSTMCVFMILWGLLVYCPICHWVWSDAGWLCEWNEDARFRALDFAGGTVVHISSGVSALVCALFVGKRIGFGKDPMPPHNLTYTCIGTALLWVGWFGFNAGSALGAGTSAVNAFVGTHLAASAGVLAWSIYEWVTRGKPTMLGACSGAVAGLVCITPACGSVSAMSAIILGLIAGAVCCWACTGLKNTFKYDDSLDAFGVHGVGGAVGALLTGVFATRLISGGTNGLIESGNPSQLVNQLVGIAASAGFAAVVTGILLAVLNATMGLRVSPEDEQRGVDLAEHGEEGYIFL